MTPPTPTLLTARRPLGAPLATALTLALAVVSCGPPPPEGAEAEEIAKAADEVPDAVQLRASLVAQTLGATEGAWFWDTEDETWECRLTGLDRVAELDVHPDGTFEELELVYTLAELEAALPDMAEFVRRQCRGDKATSIELSLRRETLLDPLPDLAEAWTRSGVVLEFQCDNGNDFEVDAKNLVLESRADDVDDDR